MEKEAREVRAAETNIAERSTLMKGYLVSIHACNAFGACPCWKGYFETIFIHWLAILGPRKNRSPKSESQYLFLCTAGSFSIKNSRLIAGTRYFLTSLKNTVCHGHKSSLHHETNCERRIFAI